MARRSSFLLGLAAVLALAGSGGASPAAPGGKPSAEAFAIQVSVPGRGGATAGAVSGPPDAVGVGGSFAYPADGSIVRAGSVSSSAAGAAGATTTASASVDVSGLSLFGGEVTVGSVSARSTARARRRSATGGTSGSAVSGFTVEGQAVGTAPGTSVALGDWGTASIVQRSASPFGTAPTRGYRTSVTALHVHVNVEHAGVPAGTDIVVGFTEASAQAAPVQQTRPRPSTVEEAPKPRRPTPKDKEEEANDGGSRPSIPPVRGIPFNVFPKLTAGGYVFPVYGQAPFTNTFGAPRAAPVGWHHGEDIFAPLGAPVLAVANGTVFSVGWNDIGGLRVWLQDLAGNEFYYAHLSAFSPLALNGAQVRAGDVLGFVGNTGDAEATPPHLHFEIHPVSLMYLGYDGVVAPYPYLLAWKRLIDLPFAAVAGWAPPIASSSRAPRPGAILIQARDISSASGLEPGALRRAISASGSQGADGSLTGLVREGPRTLRSLAQPAGP